MDRRGISILIACALAAAALVIVVSRRSPPQRAEPDAVAQRANEQIEPAQAGRQPPETTEAATPPPRTSAPPFATLHGRVLDAATDQPLAGVPVRLEAWVSLAEGLRAIATTKTDDAGAFELALQGDEAAKFQVQSESFRRDAAAPAREGESPVPIELDLCRLSVDSSDHGMHQRRIEPFARAERRDAGTIRLRTAPRVTGYVTAPGGSVPRGFQLTARPVRTGSRLRATGETSTVLRLLVQADGRFASDRGALPGTYRLSSDDRAFALLEPDRFEVPEQGNPPVLHVQVHARLSIRGVLQNLDGAPLPNVILTAEGAAPRSGGQTSRVTTDDAGRFSFVAGDRDDPPIRIRIAEQEPFVLAQDPGPIPWGRDSVQLVAQRKPGSHLQVRVAIDRVSVTIDGFGMQLLDADGAPVGQPRISADPVLNWPSLAPGRYRLLVLPFDPGARLSRRTWVDIDDREESVTVTLDPMLAINVVARDEQGDAIAGATVECIDLPEGECAPDAPALERRALLEDDRRLTAPLLLGSGTTASDGYAAIAVPLHGEHAVLRLRADGFVTTRLPCPERWVFDTELEVTLRRAR